MVGENKSCPGVKPNECPLRIAVDPHFTGMASREFSCTATGGLCIPCEFCETRIEKFVNGDPLDGIY